MAAAIEPPLAFLQEPIKTVFWDAVKAAQMSLGLVPKILNTVDVVTALADKSLAMVHTLVMKLRHIQHIIGRKTVRVDNTVGRDFLTDDGDQRGGFGVRNDRRVNLAAAL